MFLQKGEFEHRWRISLVEVYLGFEFASKGNERVVSDFSGCIMEVFVILQSLSQRFFFVLNWKEEDIAKEGDSSE